MIGKKVIVYAVAMATLGGSLYAFSQTGARYPKHFRRWTVAKGRMIGPNSPSFPTGGGFRYIYVNRVGREGYTNLPFPKGPYSSTSGLKQPKMQMASFRRDRRFTWALW